MGATTTPERPSAPPVSVVALWRLQKNGGDREREHEEREGLCPEDDGPGADPSKAPAVAAAASCTIGSLIPAFAARIPAM